LPFFKAVSAVSKVVVSNPFVDGSRRACTGLPPKIVLRSDEKCDESGKIHCGLTLREDGQQALEVYQGDRPGDMRVKAYRLAAPSIAVDRSPAGLDYSSLQSQGAMPQSINLRQVASHCTVVPLMHLERQK
jgi:hypothetical protein